MRTPLIAGNWKMYMTRPQAEALVEDLKGRLGGRSLAAQVLVAPPFTALESVGRALDGTGWLLAGQNAHWEEEGAYTGEVSPSMLWELGCRFVILGHSERRQIFGERDETVNRKVKAALGRGLTPILCVGETLEERARGQTPRVVEKQLSGGLEGLEEARLPEIVIAYEPVWAIGTGRTASPGQAQEVHLMIRRWLEKRFSVARAAGTRILYGGSVKPDNVDDLMAQADLDGALVGGASLKAESFARIVEFQRRG
jgi:triosephosphate isomerase